MNYKFLFLKESCLLERTRGPCGPDRSPGSSSCQKKMIFCGKCVNDFCTLDHETALCDVTNTFAELVFIIICNMYLISFENLVMIFTSEI